MRRWIAVLLVVAICGCSIKKVETSKSLYQHAREAQEAGEDVGAVVYWKALLTQANGEIEEGNYLQTNYFLRATAHFELGNWDAGFEDLKQVQPAALRSEEFWIYPLYLVLMGDYYARQHMASVADNFYESVLKKSTWKTSPVYLLAMERRINNSIRRIESAAGKRTDSEKFRQKEFEDLAKEASKLTVEFPFESIPHFLLADLLLKTGNAEESLEHFLAALEMGLPTHDLQRSAEFEIATLLSEHEISAELKSVLLQKASRWWGASDKGSIFSTGENSMEWMLQQELSVRPEPSVEDQIKVRYLAVAREGKLKILAWEKLR